MFQKITCGGVTYIASSLLSHVPHGFSTRLGGVSLGDALGSMNMGFGKATSAVREADENVRENRRRFCRAASLPEAGKNVIVSAAEQIHSGTVFEVTHADADTDYIGDGFYTCDPTVSVGVKTADCVPILLATRDGRAVAAVHAGWRGTASGIAAVAVGGFCKLGYAPSEIVAATGPAVLGGEYRVGTDFPELLYALMEKSESESVRLHARELSRAFVMYRDGEPYCDLPELNRAILLGVGLDEDAIDVCGLSTYQSPELFYSHRRQGVNRGVMISGIAPRGMNSSVTCLTGD